MKKLFVTYMSLEAPPANVQMPNPSAAAKIIRATFPSEKYLRLYQEVGRPLGWDQRLTMSKNDLETYLSGSNCMLFVLFIANLEAGFCEFDLSAHPVFELMNFGLVSGAQGRGLGSYLLDYALRAAFAEGAKKIKLHTDTQDHPSAQIIYQKAGFVVDQRSWQDADGL